MGRQRMRRINEDGPDCRLQQEKILKAVRTIMEYCAAGECEDCMFSRPSPLLGDDLLHCHLVDDDTLPSHWEIPGPEDAGGTD